jgi:hypothetical protein
MRTTSIVTLVLFVVFLLFMLAWLMSQRGTDAIEAPMKIAQLRQAIGLFVATAAALALLMRALAGGPAGKSVMLVATLLAGVLIIEPIWSLVLGLTLISLGVMLRAWLPIPHRRLPTTHPPHEPPVL